MESCQVQGLIYYIFLESSIELQTLLRQSSDYISDLINSFLFRLLFRNALNIVKDDLIVKVDELSGEVEILSEQLNSSTQAKNKLVQKVADLEEELKKTKDLVKQQSMFLTKDRKKKILIKQIYQTIDSSDHEDEGDVPMAQRKKFTRVEMARVLMERNQVSKPFRFRI